MLHTWQEVMSQFDFTIEHIEGKHNVLADALSRTEERTQIETKIPFKEPISHKTQPLLPPPEIVVTNHSDINHYPHLKLTNYTPTKMPSPYTNFHDMAHSPLMRALVEAGNHLANRVEKQEAVMTAATTTRRQA